MTDPAAVPEDIYFRGKPKSNNIRALLLEMIEHRVSDETAQIFGILSVTAPEQRLANGLSNTMAILLQRNIRHILADGLLQEEINALLELDRMRFTDESRITARGMLCVKERYAMVKGLRGYFNSARNEEDSQLRT